MKNSELDSITNSIMTAGEWTPFERGVSIINDPLLRKLLAAGGEYELFLNNKYQVAIYRRDAPAPNWPAMIHLSIKRRDKFSIHDWRDLQRIKNELVGPEHEAVELYPAESRLVDSANQYHLWVLAEPGVKFPFGFEERFVSNDCGHGSVQRPFSKDATPTDCESVEQHLERKARQAS